LFINLPISIVSLTIKLKKDRNFEDLIKENLISKFDNVTLKTIDKKTKLDEKELDRFLLKNGI